MPENLSFQRIYRKLIKRKIYMHLFIYKVKKKFQFALPYLKLYSKCMILIFLTLSCSSIYSTACSIMYLLLLLVWKYTHYKQGHAWVFNFTSIVNLHAPSNKAAWLCNVWLCRTLFSSPSKFSPLVLSPWFAFVGKK